MKVSGTGLDAAYLKRSPERDATIFLYAPLQSSARKLRVLPPERAV